MKLKLVSFAITGLICISSTLQAQHLKKASFDLLPKNIQILRNSLLKSSNAKVGLDESAMLFKTHAKTTALTRLTSMSFYERVGDFWVPTDSSALTYSGGNSGEIGYPMLFDESVKYTYDPSVSTYEKAGRLRQGIVGGNIVEQYLQEWSGSTWDDVYKYLLTYNANGTIAQIRESAYKNNAWEDTYWSTFTYGQNGLERIDVNEWDVPQSIWKIYYRELYLISNNLVHAVETQSYESSTGQWVPYDKYSYIYNGTELSELDYQLYDKYLMAWINNIHETYTYNTQGNPESIVQEKWDDDQSTYVTYGSAEGQYNAYNQPKLITTYTWDNNYGWVLADGDIRYALHYQFEDGKGTSVSTLGNTIADIYAFPNPASGTVNISFSSPSAQKMQISLFDMFGKQIRAYETEVNVGTCLERLDVHGLAQGLYHIHFHGETGDATVNVEVR